MNGRVARGALGPLAALALLSGAGCASMDRSAPVERARNVSIERYMGAWFVIAAIPLPVENGAHDPVESYVREPDGRIATVFQFRKDGFDGALEVKPIVSELVPGTGDAEWRVQTVWPLKQQYVISYVEPDGSAAIVGRDSRDHVWILSRTPTLPADRLERDRRFIGSQGYETGRLVMFPQDGRRPLP